MGLVTGLALGAAALGAGASAISSNKASKRAAATSQANTDLNVGLARDIYGQNRQALNPFMQRGNAAGNQINALLGLGGAPMEQGGPAMMDMGSVGQYQGGQPAWSAYGMGDNGALPFARGDMIMNDYGAPGMMAMEAPMPGAMSGYAGGTFNMDGTQVTPSTLPQANVPGMTAQQAADQGFELFKRSSGFQNRFNSAIDGVSSAFAGVGGFQSGAAAKALQDRAGQVAGEEFANYMNALGGQQAVGAGSASALAGVGQNFAGTIIGANNFNAQNQMAAQLGRQNPLANTLGTIGGAGLGFLGGR